MPAGRAGPARVESGCMPERARERQQAFAPSAAVPALTAIYAVNAHREPARGARDRR